MSKWRVGRGIKKRRRWPRKRNISQVGHVLCTRACAFALQDQLVAGRVISEEDARRNKAGLRPDAFGNYLFIIRFDRTSPPILPKEYLAGEPTHCGVCGSLCGGPGSGSGSDGF